MDKQQMDTKLDNYTMLSEEYLEKAQEKAVGIITQAEEKSLQMIEKSNTMAHNIIDRANEFVSMLEEDDDYDEDYDNEYYQPQNALDYVKSYAIEHPIVTATAVSATVLAGASLINSKTRKVTVPIAKYAIKQQARFTIGVGMLAMATYLTSRMDDSMN